MYYLKSIEGDMYNIVDTRDSSESLVSLADVHSVFKSSYKTHILGLRFSLGEVNQVYPYVLFTMIDSYILTDGYCIFKLDYEAEQQDYATERYVVDYAEAYADATFKEIFYILREINSIKYRARTFNVNSVIEVEDFDKSTNTIICSDGYSYNIFDVIYSYVYENVGVAGVISISFDEIQWENGEIWRVSDQLDTISENFNEASQTFLRYDSSGEVHEYNSVTCDSSCVDNLFKDAVAIWVGGVPCYNFLAYYDESYHVDNTPLFESLESYNLSSIKPMDLSVSKSAGWHSMTRQFGLAKGVNLSALKSIYPQELVGKLNDLASKILKLELTGVGIFPNPELHSNHVGTSVKPFKNLIHYNSELDVGSIATTDTVKDDVLFGNTTYVTDYGSIVVKDYYSEHLGLMRYDRSGMVIVNSRTKAIEHVPVLKDCNVFNYTDSNFCKSLNTIVDNLAYSDKLLLPLCIKSIYSYKCENESRIGIYMLCLVKPLLSGKKLNLNEDWDSYCFSVIEVPLMLTGIRWNYDKWGRVCFRTLLQHVSMDARLLDHMQVDNYNGLSRGIIIDFYSNAKTRSRKLQDFYTEKIEGTNKKVFSAYHDLVI